MQKNNYSEYTMSWMLHALLHRVWLIIIAAVVCAGLAFSYAAFFVTPLYKSSVQLYVNTSSVKLGSANISLSDLSVSENLVDVYLIILNSKPTLNKVIETAGLDYSHDELKKMMSASSVNGTGVFEVTVTSPDRYEAEKIANCILEVLPDKVSDIIDGTSVSLVDYAEVADRKSYPNITSFTVKGLFLGMLLSALIVLLIEMQDDVVHGEDFLTKNFPNVPIMAVIPDLAEAELESYGSYGYERSSGNRKHKRSEGGTA